MFRSTKAPSFSFFFSFFKESQKSQFFQGNNGLIRFMTILLTWIHQNKTPMRRNRIKLNWVGVIFLNWVPNNWGEKKKLLSLVFLQFLGNQTKQSIIINNQKKWQPFSELYKHIYIWARIRWKNLRKKLLTSYS